MRKNLMAWLLLLAVAFPSVAKAALTGPGDIAFVAFAAQSTIADQFAVVFLKDVGSLQKVNFTSRNWISPSGTPTVGQWGYPVEVTYTWTAPSFVGNPVVKAGYVLEVFNTEPVSATVFNQSGVAVASGTITNDTPGNFLGLSGVGDNLLAYIGTPEVSPTPVSTPSAWLSALVFNGVSWDTPGATPTVGIRPSTLNGYDQSFPVSFTGGYYSCSAANQGNPVALLHAIQTPTNWTQLTYAANTDLPYNQGNQQPYGPYADALQQGFQVTPTLTATAVVGSCWTPIPTATPVPTGGGTTLSPCDLAFVALAGRSTIADQFAVVILKSGGITQGTEITFTDDNWSNTLGAFSTVENIVKWTSDGNYPAGDIIQFLNVDPYQTNVYKKDGTGNLDTVNGNGHGYVSSVNEFGILTPSGSSFGLDKGGDNLFAIQGTVNSPTFITGITFKKNWGNATVGDLPSGLTCAFYLKGSDVSFGYYDRNQGTYGTAASLSTKINNASNWAGKVDTSDTDLAVPVQPAITATWAVTP